MLSRRSFSRSLLIGGTASLALGDSGVGGTPQVPQEQDQNTKQKAMQEEMGPPAYQTKFVPGDECDLLIKGGTVVDPREHLHAAMDVAVKNGKVIEVSKDIPESRARVVVTAKGKIVTPGLIDIHVHCFDGAGYTYTRSADHYCLNRGVTTCVDAGSAGYIMIGQFRKYVMPTYTTRVHALVHMAAASVGTTATGSHSTLAIGHSLRYGPNLESVLPWMTAKVMEENKPFTVGIKVHFEGLGIRTREMEVELLKRTLEVAEATHAPIMVHVEGAHLSTPEILKMLRKGDVYTHCFHGEARYGWSPNSILDANGKVLSEVREARQRGVLFDTGEGANHYAGAFDFIEKVLAQDFVPDSISTNLNGAINGIELDLLYDMPTTLSKYMALGMSLDKAIELVTTNPAQAFDYGVQIGTLRPGSAADIGIFELYDGKFEFVDAKGAKRTGRQMLVSKSVVCRGELFSNRMENFPGATPWKFSI
jgi:dihydroorotase